MNVRRSLLLDERAVIRGEQAARERNLSLSALVEQFLFSIPRLVEEEEFWPGSTGKPIVRPRDPRYAHLRRKHA